MNRDKIGTQTCYIHHCTKRYVDIHSMSVSQSCLCSFLCNPYITLQIFYLLVPYHFFIFVSDYQPVHSAPSCYALVAKHLRIHGGCNDVINESCLNHFIV